jgi:predicted NUDIX family NTP pyrophosphohydrolase
MAMAKPPKISAGLLMCRRCEGTFEFLLAHPGGPFFKNKDDGVWTIPKGLADPGEPLLDAAKREFREETGFVLPEAEFVPLGHVVQKGGKHVYAWAFEGSCEPSALVSNTFMLEWPPRSGKQVATPEIDRVAFFELEQAKRKILEAQVPLLERALAQLSTLR